MERERMDAAGPVGARRLERAIRRTRLLVLALAVLSSAFVLGAWRFVSQLKSEKVVLTDEAGTPVLVLRGVAGFDGPALRLETPGGQEVLTLGPGVRKVR